MGAVKLPGRRSEALANSRKERKNMTFKKYNANPENKNIGDCSIRAICTATPLTYQQAKKLLETKVFESGAAWNTVKNITAALADLGIEVKAASRETVNSFTKHCDTAPATLFL